MSVAEPLVMPRAGGAGRGIQPPRRGAATGDEGLPELLSPTAMAKMLGISRWTLDRWSHADGFPVWREPHHVKFPWRAVLEWVNHPQDHQLPSNKDIKRKTNRRSRS